MDKFNLKKYLAEGRLTKESHFAVLGGSSPLSQGAFEKVVKEEIGEFEGPFDPWDEGGRDIIRKLILSEYPDLIEYDEEGDVQLTTNPSKDFYMYGTRNGDNGFRVVREDGAQGYLNINAGRNVIKGEFFGNRGSLRGGIYIKKDLYEKIKDIDMDFIFQGVDYHQYNLTESKLLKEASASGLEIYEIATPQPKSILKEELEDLFGSDYRNIITEFSSPEGYESVLMVNITDGDIEKIKENIGDVLIWKIEIGNKESIAEGKLNEGYNSSTVMAVRKLLTDDFIGNIENSAEIKIQDKGFDMLDNFFLDFISKHKESIAEGSVKGIGLKESLQQLTPEEKSLLKDILEEKAESYEFGIDRYEVFIKDPNSKIHKDEIEEMKNNSEMVKNILNKL